METARVGPEHAVLSARQQRLQRVLAVGALVVFLLLAAVLVLTVLLFYRHATDTVADRLNDRAEDLAMATADSMTAVLADGQDPAVATRELRRLIRVQHLETALILDADLRIVVDPAGGEPGTRLSGLTVDPALVAAALSSGRPQRARPPIMAEAGSAIYAPFQVAARSLVCYIERYDPTPELARTVRPPLVWALLAGLGIATLVLGIGLFAWRWAEGVRRRLQRLEGLATAGTIASAIAHEVKNPLGMILSSTQLLERKADLSSDHRAALAEIQEEVRRADDELNAFLDLVRDMPLRRQVIDLRDVIESCHALVAAQADACGIALICVLSPETVPVYGDRRRLRQALLNLVLNGFEAQPTGGQVQLHVQVVGDRVQVEVTDSGPGVPASQIGQIFEAFQTSKEHGTGLGLNTAQRICERHGGSLQYVPGGPGARFRISLPLAPAGSEEAT